MYRVQTYMCTVHVHVCVYMYVCQYLYMRLFVLIKLIIIIIIVLCYRGWHLAHNMKLHVHVLCNQSCDNMYYVYLKISTFTILYAICATFVHVSFVLIKLIHTHAVMDSWNYIYRLDTVY